MQPNPTHILELASSFYDSCVLFAALDVNLFGSLAVSEGGTAESVAGDLGLDQRGCRLLLDACVAVGLLEKSGDKYSNTPEAGIFLVPGSPADLSDAIGYNRDVYPAWGKLAQLVRTGRPVESPSLHLGDDADRTRGFVMAMHSRCLAIGRAVVPMLNLEGRKSLLDVGGGPGTYSVLIAQQNPGISCTVMDLPAVSAIASELIKEQGMADRVEAVAGDYHTTEFPDGLDAVIFFGVLHQESPESIMDLFRRAHAALEPGGVVYVLDMMTDETRANPRFSALFAVNMALTTENGWVFSDADLTGWLTGAGFGQPSISELPPPMPHWLAMAVKP
jgi:ubiquinone/menaquinone biosynthesis C-methylase UbiE